ncbi:PREDICTED: B-cell lymphoma 3 protein-like [Cyprinodon variegatus]|uniref:BCL3 transcription coactivator n=1 Tax=Cyprinodon variegatus TaxID=28743 RepID=A0A3Q2D339_CYPVA|nr:PREDICTED: B-cell lymphoma 3 protein-like [Cyprinodon variegatus]
MPSPMTMSVDHQSVATAPLDLSTTGRGRRSGGDLTFCDGDARASGGSPAPPASTGTDSSVLHRSPDTDSTHSRKRTADGSPIKSPSTLPFRKRHFLVEAEAQKPAPPAAAAEEQTVREPARPRLGKAEDETRFGVAPVTHRRTDQAAHSPEGYPCCILPLINYGHYPVCCLTPFPEPHHPQVHQTDNLLAGISLAKHQDEDGDTPLHIAVVQGELPIVHKLIQLLLLARTGLDIYNNLRQTPLHLAVITKQANIVEVLLRAGADPAVLDRHGQTALHLCCEYQQLDCLSVLLSLSSSSPCLEIRNFEGLSPLHLAVLQGHHDLTKMLLDAGADINAMDIKSGQSPLIHAVESNNADMVHFLIENGCDVNSQSYSGNTALHIACGRGQVDTVRLLLKSGADSSLKNYHNDTPVMVAKNKKITDVLRGRGSKIRFQEQPCASMSPHQSCYMENGSPSSNHSRGSSPLMTPHSLNPSASHSLKTSSALY